MYTTTSSPEILDRIFQAIEGEETGMPHGLRDGLLCGTNWSSRPTHRTDLTSLGNPSVGSKSVKVQLFTLVVDA